MEKVGGKFGKYNKRQRMRRSMTVSLKKDLTPRFMEMIEKSQIAKSFSLSTGLTAFEILSQAGLDVSTQPMTCIWPSSLKIGVNSDLIHELLKFAWMNSSQFYEAEAADQISNELLLEEAKGNLGAAQITKKMYMKELKCVENRLNRKLQKERSISHKCSEAAQKTRSCPRVNEWLAELAQDRSRSKKEKWFLIGGRDSREFYLENGKLYHNDCDYKNCKPFGQSAYYRKLKDFESVGCKNNSS